MKLGTKVAAGIVLAFVGCKIKSVNSLTQVAVGFRFSISEQDRHLKIHNALFHLDL